MNAPTASALRKGLVAVLAVSSLPMAAAHAGLLDKLKSAIHNVPAQGRQAVEKAATGAVQQALGSSSPAAAGNGSAAATPAALAQTAQNTAAKAAAAAPAETIPAPPADGAAILKSAPKLSAGAFYIGMPEGAAVAKLKALRMLDDIHNYGVGVFDFKINQIPGQDLVGGAAGYKGHASIQLNFTVYPNTPAVSAIGRRLTFDDAHAPTVGATIAALRKKYGPESMHDLHDTTLFWFFDYQGRPLSKAATEQFARTGCPQSDAALSIEPVGSRNHVSDRITQGLPRNYSKCNGVISVKAQIGCHSAENSYAGTTADKGWDSIAQSLLTQLQVYIYDMPLEYNASETTRNLALHHEQQEKQKELNAAKDRAAPSL